MSIKNTELLNYTELSFVRSFVPSEVKNGDEGKGGKICGIAHSMLALTREIPNDPNAAHRILYWNHGSAKNGEIQKTNDEKTENSEKKQKKEILCLQRYLKTQKKWIETLKKEMSPLQSQSVRITQRQAERLPKKIERLSQQVQKQKQRIYKLEAKNKGLKVPIEGQKQKIYDFKQQIIEQTTQIDILETNLELILLRFPPEPAEIPEEFNESVFSSYDHVQGFLENEVKKASQKILSEKDQPCPEPLKEYHPHHMSKQKSKETKALRLANTENCVNEEGKIVTKHPPIHESKILDQQLINKTFCSIEENRSVNFIDEGGVCRGMVLAFIRTYWETRREFEDTRHHITAVAKQFFKGGGADVAVLQALNTNKGRILKLNIGTQKPGSGEIKSVKSFKIHTADWEGDPEDRLEYRKKISDSFENLRPSAYIINRRRHAMAFIKIDDHLSYFFDPNHGLYEIKGPEQTELLYDLMRGRAKEPDVFKVYPTWLRWGK